MATRIENILLRARDTLADPEAERWSDDRLLRILDEGQKDLAKQTQILKGRHEFIVEIGVDTYTLPENLWLIQRASFDSTEIPLYSYDNMDERAKKQRLSRGTYDSRERGRSVNIDYIGEQRWELDEGDQVAALIFDNRNLDQIRVYPIPNEGIAENNYPFENAGTIEFAGDEYFGVVTGLTGEPDYTFDSVFGEVTQLFDPSIQSEQIDDFGFVTDIVDSTGAVNIWYTRIPDTLTDVLDELEMPSMFDTALKHYVVAHAFRDDLDVQYRDMAAESMQLYNRELDVAKNTNSTNGTSNANNFRSTYSGAFD